MIRDLFVAITGYDFLNPIFSGVDVSSLACSVPSWAWPLILIAVTALFQFLRDLADPRNAEEPAVSFVETRR